MPILQIFQNPMQLQPANPRAFLKARTTYQYLHAPTISLRGRQHFLFSMVGEVRGG
jgi:hypothetical protein